MNLSLEQENKLLGSALSLLLIERGNSVRIDLIQYQNETAELHYDFEVEGAFAKAVTITRITQDSKLVN